MHVRTTLNLDDELLRRGREYTGIQETTALIHAALQQLIAREAAKRLAAGLVARKAAYASCREIVAQVFPEA